MAISNANIKTAKTAAKEAGAVKEAKATAPKPAPKANAPKANAPKVNLQSKATKQSAESVSVAPVTVDENVGKLSETLEVVETLKTESKIDTIAQVENGKYAVGATFKTEENGKTSVSRPFTALIKVRNNHTEPVKYFSFAISDDEVKVNDNTTRWGQAAMHDVEGAGRELKEIPANGGEAYLTYTEFCALAIRPEYNNQVTGGQFKYTVNVSTGRKSNKKEGFASTEDKARSTFSIRSYGKDYVSLHDAIGGVVIKATGVDDKKFELNEDVAADLPKDVRERLAKVVDKLNVKTTRGASGTRIARKAKATNKRDEKFDVIIASLKLDPNA